MSEEKAVRYPECADTLDKLEKIVDDCPPWAVSKFVVIYQGKRLDYGAAVLLVAAWRNRVGR